MKPKDLEVFEKVGAEKKEPTTRGRKSGKQSEAASSTAPETPAPPRPKPAKVETYYEMNGGAYWTQNGKREWQRCSVDEMTRILKVAGYWHKPSENENMSPIERYLNYALFHNSLHWAGELGGWPVGPHTLGETRILIVRGRRPIVPKRGPFPRLRRFLKTLLGKEQITYFLGWLKGSLAAFEAGPPFRPGQLLALCGESGCGKSFLQRLITAIFGGRQGDPTKFLVGESRFTGTFLHAEHLLIEDKALKDFTNAKRRDFANNLKTLAVNQSQDVERKGKDANLFPVGTRITLSCNDDPAAIAILPALDSDIKGKVIYLMCKPATLPIHKNPRMTWARQEALLLGELPAFLHWLEEWEVPNAIRDKVRFSVKAYHHPAIVAALQQLTPEQRLLQLFEVLPLSWPDKRVKSGSANQIEQWLRKHDEHHQLDRLLTYNTKLSHLLSKLAQIGEERIKVNDKGNVNIYEIYQDECCQAPLS